MYEYMYVFIEKNIYIRVLVFFLKKLYTLLNLLLIF